MHVILRSLLHCASCALLFLLFLTVSVPFADQIGKDICNRGKYCISMFIDLFSAIVVLPFPYVFLLLMVFFFFFKLFLAYVVSTCH